VNEAAVAELYRANIRTARAFAVAITGDPTSAEDLVQDAFIRCGRSDLAHREPLLTALRTLPVRQRTAVAARFLLDWSEAQTAEAMDCPIGTVKSLTSRGISALHDRLAKENAAHG
jgi:DNA-directed RNA polymerase specialized sigma24 family protein